jgi:hypothetical protein
MSGFKFRFRRSVGFGPFRLNFTKRGVGGSVGVPGARFSVHSTGRKTTSVGIPGSGAYWRRDEQIRHDAAVAQQRATTSAPTPGFYDDPFGRAELRYWNGADWASRVIDHGQLSDDPLT